MNKQCSTIETTLKSCNYSTSYRISKLESGTPGTIPFVCLGKFLEEIVKNLLNRSIKRFSMYSLTAHQIKTDTFHRFFACHLSS